MTSDLSDTESRVLRIKAALPAVSLTLVGMVLIMLVAWISKVDLRRWDWLHLLPLGSLGVLVGAGLLGIIFEYSFHKVQEESTVKQFLPLGFAKPKTESSRCTLLSRFLQSCRLACEFVQSLQPASEVWWVGVVIGEGYQEKRITAK